jgi:tetratricopeptide (TPR) repeat protein
MTGLPTWAWKLLRLVLTLGVCASLLVGAVLLVLAVLVIAEGKRFEFLGALSGGLVSAGIAWLLGKGAGAARKRATDQAIAEHAHAIRLDPPNANSHYNQGVACAGRRAFPKAIAHFDAAIRLDPNLAYAYVGRVNAYIALGQYNRVIADYTEAIRQDPNNALAHAARATAYNRMGRFDLSIPDAEEAIRLAPQSFLGYDARGYGLWHRGNFNWILKLLAIAWMVATLAFLRRGHFDWRTPTGTKADFEQAVADFTEAIRLNPAALDCYQGRARAYQALGKHAEAAADNARCFTVR